MYWTSSEAAKELRVSIATIYRCIESGKVRAVRIGSQWRIPAGEAERAVANSRPSPYAWMGETERRRDDGRRGCAVTYTPAELEAIEHAAAILKAHGAVDDPEARAAAERAAYEAEIAASAERAARDPIAQAGFAAERKRAEEKRRHDVEERKAAAKSDSRAAATEYFDQTHIRANLQCMECRTPVYRYKEPGAGYILCMTCWGRHALTCDQCGRKGELTRFGNDHLWHCDSCVPEFLANPLSKKTGRVFFPTMASPR